MVDGENIFVLAHSVYGPLEFFGNHFSFKYIGKFYRDNLQDLKEFSSSSEAKKSEMYKNISTYYPFFIYSERFLLFEEEINSNRNNKFNYEAKNLLSDEFENLFVKDSVEDFYKQNNKNPSYERLYYSYSEYKEILLESERFANWFNRKNVNLSNPNFEPELVRKFKSFLINSESLKSEE